MCLRCYVRERSRQETIKASSISNQSATAAATSSSSTRQQQSATGDMNKETQPNTVDGGEDQSKEGLLKCYNLSLIKRLFFLSNGSTVST